MIIKTAVFKCSNTEMSKLPPNTLPEYAFIGRSNVGKSSLINMLTGQLKLAKTSQTPGKTQLVNHFLINDNWYLVDLPGYGYARVSKTSKESWGKMVRKYLTVRENLVCTMILIDSRLEPQKVDLEFIDWMGEKQLPFCLVFTKADKNKPMATERNVKAFLEKLSESWEELPSYFITSSVEKLGRNELLGYIDGLNAHVME